MFKVNKILVPLDFSVASQRALKYARALSQQLGATVDVLHVGSEAEMRGLDEVSVLLKGVPGSTLESYNERDAQRALTVLLRDAGFDREVRNDEIEQGKPGEVIVQRIKDGGYDLVVIGTRGRRKGLSRFVGSVAMQVVQDSPVPVFTCQPEHA
ncbi:MULTISPECIES: universal stress protein [Myxococcaceae]|uniref:universal stress protein n=1 Tax=Myxococcaceae TaxID=31 RepID=UPI00188F0F89|nr:MULTISPECIES: universal stress protein [Myxococcaceae]MBF5041123.1 universal stress protein [Simulacricoccus sp. 17bor-14]